MFPPRVSKLPSDVSQSHIVLEGVRVHNLRNIDVQLPLGKLTVVTGVSGAGKSSLVFDTLHAEGQRRYVESLSADAARYVERVDRPDADRLDFLPPSIAVSSASLSFSERATLATAAEIHDYLQLLYAAAGRIVCVDCGTLVRQDSSAHVVDAVRQLPAGTRVQFGAAVPLGDQRLDETLRRLAREGFARAIVGESTVKLTADFEQALAVGGEEPRSVIVAIDRVVSGRIDDRRLYDSAEQAFRAGFGTCLLLCQGDAARVSAEEQREPEQHTIDGQRWQVARFSRRLDCARCGRVYLPLAPDLFSFNSAQGACPQCAGLGYETRAAEAGSIAQSGAEQKAGRGTRRTCQSCGGTRLRAEALAVRLDGINLAELSRLTVGECLHVVARWREQLGRGEPAVRPMLLDEVGNRLQQIDALGLDYLTLDCRMRAMSAGEIRRVALAEALCAGLVNALWVLDEPAVGMHPREVPKVVAALERLRDAGNTVVVVEHEPRLLATADYVVELGPGGGRDGGQVTFAGTAADFGNREGTAGALLSTDDSQSVFPVAAPPEADAENEPPLPAPAVPSGWLKLRGATRNNLRDFALDVPLGVLCVVCGVSGSGKRPLVECLFAGVSRALGSGNGAGDEQAAADFLGAEPLGEVVFVDQRPIRYSSRSVPATTIGAFDEIRQVFAAAPEAKRRNFTPRHFSFNVRGAGACPRCAGQGRMTLDMEFLADVSTTCPECGGTRYRPEILEVKYRGKTIADVLQMTIEEAFGFFRAQRKLQQQLHGLREVGLGYLPLGQPLNTLSAGESQRLRLTVETARSRAGRTLFLLDEPTIGLHPRDVRRLLSFLGRLRDVGHSLVIIEHNPALLNAADYLIELGPGSGDQGGRLLAVGTQVEIAGNPASLIGPYLAPRRVN